MAKVEVYLFTAYDHDSGQMKQALRPTTLERIKGFRGEPIMESRRVVDDSLLDGNGRLLPEHVQYFLLRTGTKPERIASSGTMHTTVLARILKGRHLLPGRADLPAVSIAGQGDRPALVGLSTPSFVIIKIDNHHEAQLVDATPEHFHLVEGLSPADLQAELAT